MTKTRAQLVERALTKLGVVGAGQTANAEDIALVDGSVDSVMSDLADRQLYAWGDPDQLDDSAFEHLAGLLAIANARDYGEAPDEQVRILLESRLRQLNRAAVSGAPVRVEYF